VPAPRAAPAATPGGDGGDRITAPLATRRRAAPVAAAATGCSARRTVGGVPAPLATRRRAAQWRYQDYVDVVVAETMFVQHDEDQDEVVAEILSCVVISVAKQKLPRQQHIR